MGSHIVNNNQLADDFAALLEEQNQPHVAVIWRGDVVLFLEEHPNAGAATGALTGALLSLDDHAGVQAYIAAA